MFFHLSDPRVFGVLAPVVNAGYVMVSFFFLLSGYVMAYNYADRARAGRLDLREFWLARFARLYPVYFVSLLIAGQLLWVEWGFHTHARFVEGAVLTVCMLQAWSPSLATFWSTPYWAVSAEVFFYLLFPWLIRARLPAQPGRVAAWFLAVWAVGFVLPVTYILLHPDGLPAPDRLSGGWWLRALKFDPLVHVPTFCCGILLARLQATWRVSERARVAMALAGLAGAYTVLAFAYATQQRYWTYPLTHDPLLVPLFGLVILGLSGSNWLSGLLASKWLVIAGESSYCLYILHFTLWHLLHTHTFLQAAHMQQVNPWVCYALIIAAALAMFRWVEEPSRRWIKRVTA